MNVESPQDALSLVRMSAILLKLNISGRVPYEYNIKIVLPEPINFVISEFTVAYP